MIKHNLISLITHSKNVANISAIIAREHSEPIKTQAATWQFGFAHDTGWLNLKTVGQTQEGFEHDDATVNALTALKRLANVEVFFTVPDDLLVRFASLHARQHERRRRRKVRREIKRLLENEGYSPNILDYVCWADSLATALEIPGIHHAPKILHFFTTPLYLDVPDHHFNIMRKHVHAYLLSTFIKFLEKIKAEIISQLKVPFNPIISASLRGVEYTLDTKSNERLLHIFKNWVSEKVATVQKTVQTQPYSTQEIVDALFFRPITQSKTCIFCGSPSRYIKNLHTVNAIFARKTGKTNRLTASFWTERIQGSERIKGVCPVCFYALMEIPFRRKPKIAVAMPHLNALVVRRKRLMELLSIWRRLADEGFCKPNPVVFNIETWLNSPLLTRYYEDLDSRAEAYNYVKKLYAEVCEVLKERFEVEDLSVIAFLKGNLNDLADQLELKNFPLLLVNSLKIVDDINTVILGSYPLRREDGLIAIRFLGAILSGKVTEELSASSSIEEFMALIESSKALSERMKRRILSIVAENIGSIERVFEEVKTCCEEMK